VSSHQPLSGKTALAGNDSQFYWSKRPRDQSFSEEFSEMGAGVGCRLVGKLSGKSAFVGNER